MTNDDILFYAGIILTLLTLASYWALWPKSGVSHPLLRSKLEPFIMVGLTTGLVIGAGMFFAGLVPG